MLEAIGALYPHDMHFTNNIESRDYQTFFICRLIILTVVAIDLLPSIGPEIEDATGSTTSGGQKEFLQWLLGFLVTWSIAILIEAALVISSLRGTILEDELRWHSEYLLYIKLGKSFNTFLIKRS